MKGGSGLAQFVHSDASPSTRYNTFCVVLISSQSYIAHIMNNVLTLSELADVLGIEESDLEKCTEDEIVKLRKLVDGESVDITTSRNQFRGSYGSTE